MRSREQFSLTLGGFPEVQIELLVELLHPVIEKIRIKIKKLASGEKEVVVVKPQLSGGPYALK